MISSRLEDCGNKLSAAKECVQVIALIKKVFIFCNFEISGIVKSLKLEIDKRKITGVFKECNCGIHVKNISLNL